MSEKLFKGNCGKCGTSFIFPISEVPLHVIDPGVILCWKCCKEVHWNPIKITDRCKACSERTMCKGLFLNNMKSYLGKLKGL